ncbi:unnamed protein product [Cylindrotheca closterium]|uniref:N-acetyltransferase domain-containing protein n=1 Tax=Cylindrotheca closterium TaxID=2856 RepID=A0AAD2FMU6_9STRA|nr:unnamed protein product [Cylindrotheca closterium]
MKFTILFSLTLLQGCLAFIPNNNNNNKAGRGTTTLLPVDSKTTQLPMFFAEEVPKKEEATSNKFDAETVDLVSSQNERYINMVGAFLVDNFWLGSMHHDVSGDMISDTAKRSLVIEQSADLQEKYGEQMGVRTLDGQILSVLDAETKDMLAVVTLKSTLLVGETVMESERAESIAKNAVAALSPQLRREYKKASIQRIADELLPEDTQAIALVANLAVASSARGRGIAKYLCDEVEDLAKSWGFSDIWLIVESENAAARSLYEGKLGYTVAFGIENDDALRADPATGEFEEVQVDSLVMKKSI